MGRILNEVLYTRKTILTGNELIPFSDKDQPSKKTRNLLSSDLLTYIAENLDVNAINQDNIGQLLIFSFVGEPSTTAFATILNELDAFAISDVQNVMFKAIQIGASNPKAYVMRLINKGKGAYGVGGVEILPEDLQFISISNSATEDYEFLPETIVIDYGALANPNTILTYINTSTPFIIQGQEDGYTIFTGTIDGVQTDYLWLGDGGLFGTGELQALEENVQLIYSISNPNSAVPSLQDVTNVGYLTNKPIISSFGNFRTIVNTGVMTTTNTSTGATVEVQPLQITYKRVSGSNQLSIVAPDTLTGGVKTQKYQDKSGTIALVEKEYKALITQSSTSNPTVIVLKNTLGFTLTWVRDAVGEYTATAALIGINPFCDTPSHSVSLGTSALASKVTIRKQTDTNFVINTLGSSNTLADSILNGQPISITIYE